MANTVVTKDGEIFRIACGAFVVEVYDRADLPKTLEAINAMKEAENEQVVR